MSTWGVSKTKNICHPPRKAGTPLRDGASEEKNPRACEPAGSNARETLHCVQGDMP
jgi:hypothetical protein